MAKAGTLGTVWIPRSFAVAVKNRFAEISGLALIVAALAMASALATYSVGDPSWSYAVSAAPTNALGADGAVFADTLLQIVGVAALVPVLACWSWGITLMVRHRLPRPRWRIAVLVLSIPLAAVAAACVPTTASWPLAVGFGGVVGDLGGTLLASLAAMNPSGANSVVMGAACTALAGVGVAAGLGASWFGALTFAGSCRRRSAQAWALGHNLLGRVRTYRADLGRERPSAVTVASEPPSDVKTPEPGLRDLVVPKAPHIKRSRKTETERQGKLAFDAPGYQPPPIDLLKAPPVRGGPTAVDEEALRQNARVLAGVLEDFGVRGEIVKVRPGPVITLYELEPSPGTKSSRVIGLADDIARSMSAVSVRVAVVPGRNVIGIELPNRTRETVFLRELLASQAFERSKGPLTLALGKDIGGGPVFVDLARMPHLLIAGTTGSGKSVAINTMILSLLHRLPPDVCKLILIDPKMLELSVYDGIPHLLSPVVTDPSKAVVALKWAVREMEERYRMMSQLGVRNIGGFNARVEDARRRGETLVRRVQTGFDDDGKPVIEEQPLDLQVLPFIVVVVDEMADLMLVAGKDIEAAIQRLAQMARAAGIHLIMATQRPSVDVITGTIKANFPTRVSFQVTTKIDSRTILGEQGAEQLLGQGDMLYAAGGGRLMRVHGPFVSDDEVEDVVRFLRSQGEPAYVPEVTEEDESAGWLAEEIESVGGTDDGLYDEAVAIVARDGKASTSYIQRRLQIGYNRAARLIERMEAEGVVSKPDRVGRREVLVGDHSG